MVNVLVLEYFSNQIFTLSLKQFIKPMMELNITNAAILQISDDEYKYHPKVLPYNDDTDVNNSRLLQKCLICPGLDYEGGLSLCSY